MKTPPILGGLNSKPLALRPGKHMAGVFSSISCMQVVTASQAAHSTQTLSTLH